MNSVKMASGPRDVSDFKFVQMRPVQLETNGELEDEVYKRPTQLLAVANKIGLIFAGIRNGFSVVNVGSFETVDISCDPKLKKVPASAANGEVSHTFSVPLPASPSHLAVNSDETIISVALILKGLPVIVMFDTRAVLANRNNAKPFLQIPPNTPPGTFIQDIQWNPVTQNLISVVYSNGSLAIFAVPDDASRPPDCWTLPPAEGITCINWSPKGKQLVAGRNNGSLTQYKPDLKEAKTLSGPDGKNVCPVSILWLSTYQFIVAFKDKDDQDSRPGLYLVQGSKAGSTTFTCFDDICYSMGDNRISNFYSISLSEWGIVLVASANSIEVGILGTQDKEQLNWLQWVPPDGGRAEIPLKPDKSERYPVGVALSISSQRQLQFGEKVSAVSFPILTLLTSDGLLTGFYAVNQDPAAAQITKPCEALSMAGMRKETIELPKPAPTPAQSQPQQPSIPPPPFPTTTPTIPKPFADSPKPGLGFSGQTPFASSTPAKPAPKPVQIGFGTPTAVKPSITPAAAPSPAAQTKPAVAKVEKPKQETISVSDVAVANAILEEMKLFDKDLKKLKERSASLNVNIGSQSEKMELKQGLDSADRFCKDLIEITASQAKEIAELQKTNLQLFSWAEDAKSRDVRNRNPKYRQLLKNRSLDPASQKRMNNLETKFRFVDQQLNQVNEMLDMEWAEHVDRTKSKNLSGRTPTKAIVYKAILSNRHLIESEKMTLNKITKDMKALRLKGAVSLGSDKTDQTQMSKMSEMFQEKSKIFDETQKSEVKARAALSSPGIGAGFSPEKHSALRSFLTSKGTTKLKPTKPATLDESIFLKMTTEGKANESKSKALVEQLSKKVDSEMMAKASELASKATSVVPSTAVGLGDQGKSRFGMKQTGSQLQLQEQGPIHKSSSYTGSLSSLSQPGTSTPVSGFASAPKPAFSLDEMSALLQQQVVKPKSKEGTPIFGTTSAVKSGEPQGASFGAILTDENKPLSGFLMKKEASPSAATTTKQSVTQTEQKPIFGLPSTAPEKTTLSAAEPAPLFGGNKASTPVTSSIKPTASEPAGTPIFGNAGQGPKPTSMSGFGDKPSIFGGASAPTPLTAATSATTSGSIFGGASASTPSTAVTSATTPGSIFGGASASESIFGGAALKTSTTAPVSESKPVDGRGVKTSETDASRVVTTTSTGSIFGSSSSSSIFGSNTSSSMFGGSSKPIAPTTTDSVFGTPSTTTSSSTSKSDSTLKPATGTTIFGTTTTTTEEKPSGSIFGAASSSGGSIFGGSSSSTLNPSSGSMFGGSTATSPSAATAGGSIFGGSIDTTTAPSGSIFGGSATASAPSGGSIFGGNSSAPAGGSIFGGSSGGSFGKPSASGSIFVATTTAASSGSIFGGSTTTSPSSLFGGGASTTVSGGSIFGGSTVSSPTTTTSSSSTPLFGSGSIFAAAAASSAATSSSSSGTIFGNAPVSKSASLFGVSSNTATSASGAIFGSGGGFFSGLGSSTSSENANKNPFGSATFGQSSSADTSNLFGNQSSGSVFSGSANATGASSGGLFSGSGGSVAAQGFGAGTSPVKSGFGAPATFGGSPAFGSPPAFGSKPAAAFGGPPSLGSSFGAAPAFGSANDAPTFGSLGGSATFGSLSQQAAPPFGTQPQGFGSFAPSGTTTNSGSTTFNASPAFSSWR